MELIDLEILPLAAALVGMMILIWIISQWLIGREKRKKQARMLEVARTISTHQTTPVPMRPYLASGPSQDAVAVTVKEEAKPGETKRDRYEVVKV